MRKQAQKKETAPCKELVSKYRKILAKNKIPITPSKNRPVIVEKLFYLYQKHSGKIYTEIDKKIVKDFHKNCPEIPKAQIIKIQKQILRSDSMHISAEGGKSFPFWMTNVRLKKSVGSPAILNFNIDTLVVTTIKRELGAERIDPIALSLILYGTSKDPKLIKRAEGLISVVTSGR